MNQTKKGVTLLELITVLSILSIISLIGFTSYDSVIKEQNAKRCVEQSGYAIKQAKHYARINGVETKLEFDVGAEKTINNKVYGAYEIYAGDKLLTNEDSPDSFSGLLPQGTKTISNTCSDIYFYVDGTPLNSSGTPISSNCKITFGYDDQPQKSLTLVAISGNIIYDN